jgi:hypothetical protein
MVIEKSPQSILLKTLIGSDEDTACKMLDLKLSFYPGRHVAVANDPSIPRFSALKLICTQQRLCGKLSINGPYLAIRY